MSRLTPTRVSLAAGLVLGVAGFSTTFALMPSPTSGTTAPNDRISAAVAELRKTHLYIGPEDRWRFTAAQVKTLQTTLAHQRIPTYLAYWDTSDGDWGITIGQDALSRIAPAIGDKGYYFSADSSEGTVDGQGIGYQAPYFSQLDNPAQPGPSLVTMLDQVNKQDPEPPWNKESGKSSRTGPIIGGIALGLLGVALLGGLMWVVGRIRRAIG